MERRKHRRFKVRDGILAVLGPDSGRLGQIIDISEGGLAFSHEFIKAVQPDPSELRILFDDAFAEFSDLSFRFSIQPVMDKKIPSSFASEKMRCSVRFRRLTYHQNLWIRRFLADNVL